MNSLTYDYIYTDSTLTYNFWYNFATTYSTTQQFFLQVNHQKVIILREDTFKKGLLGGNSNYLKPRRTVIIRFISRDN